MKAVSTDIPGWLKDLSPLTVMDGDCTLCSTGARLIHRLDRTGEVRILPIQTELGRSVLRHFSIDPEDPETWLYIDGKAAWAGLDAMIVLAARCGGWGHGLAPLRLLPGPLRARVYGGIARNRYRLFGRSDLCALPDPGLQARLIR